jgi:hypothetical protein
MIVKYSTGTINDIIPLDDNKQELEDKLIEATELSEEDKLVKEAAKKQSKPFWLKK